MINKPIIHIFIIWGWNPSGQCSTAAFKGLSDWWNESRRKMFGTTVEIKPRSSFCSWGLEETQSRFLRNWATFKRNTDNEINKHRTWYWTFVALLMRWKQTILGSFMQWKKLELNVGNTKGFYIWNFKNSSWKMAFDLLFLEKGNCFMVYVIAFIASRLHLCVWDLGSFTVAFWLVILVCEAIQDKSTIPSTAKIYNEGSAKL